MCCIGINGNEAHQGEALKPELKDSRRLTGANLFWDLPAAIIDVDMTDDPSALIAAWSGAARALLESVGRSDEYLTHRTHTGGLSLLISAPIDVLYSMCELNDASFAMAMADLGFGSRPGIDQTSARLRALFDEESNPALLAMQQAARRHDVPFLWDDDHVSVGYGKTAIVWTPDNIPDPEEIDWPAVSSIPVALVTGTNGKSTTVRMSASIMEAAGLQAGLTSTDWIRIGKTILDTGDYSGTGGARTLMRHPRTEVAVLETARGGLLRRGLGIERAAAAVITNVAADHLGDYGINTVAELTEAKFIVRRALNRDAPLILNADDSGVVAYSRSLDCSLMWFSLDPHNRVILEHRDRGGRAAVLNGDQLELIGDGRARPIIDVSDIAATMGGVARHNVQNALAAMALCSVLGAPDEAIHRGLAAFRGDEEDNPGRGNWFENRGIRILVDFAHNEHGMLALADMIGRIPAKRRVVLMGQAGDRLDKDISDLAIAACSIGPDAILACALPGYERGRPQSEVLDVIRNAAIECGVASEQVVYHDSPVEAAASALAKAKSGDLLIFLALTQREKVLQLVHEFIDA